MLLNLMKRTSPFHDSVTIYKNLLTLHYVCSLYIYIYSSYGERIQRKQSAQYRKRRAITVKVTLSSARCDTVFHIRR